MVYRVALQWMICEVYFRNTDEHLSLRLQICINLTPVSIYLNFGLVVYFIETQVQQPKIIETCV